MIPIWTIGVVLALLYSLISQVWSQWPALFVVALLLIAALIVRMKRRHPVALIQPLDVFDLSPIGYERYCAHLLKGRGWKVEMTAATTDHGGDLIAERDGNRMVMQCKLYRNAVGNSAVQQVIAAREYYDAGGAAVICPSGYTAAARQLARKTGVRLLSQDDLQEL